MNEGTEAGFNRKEHEIKEPTTKEEGKVLIAKLKDLSKCIDFFVGEQELENELANRIIFAKERETGEKASEELYTQAKQAVEGLKAYKREKEGVHKAIREVEQKWGLLGSTIESIGPWKEYNSNRSNTADLTYGELYRFINRFVNKQHK